MNRSRRNRLVHLLALAALAAGVPLAIDATPAGAAAGACGASYDKVWTGATGDGLWDTAANWTDGQGNPGVPGPASNVCIDTGAGGAVRAANGLSVGRLSLAGGPSDPAVDVSGLILVTSAIGGESRLVLSGEATLTAVHVEVDLTVASGADVAVKAGFGQQRHDALDVSGTLHLQKSARLWETIVRDGGRIDTVGTVGGDLVLAGDLDIRPGGAFVVTGRSASGGLINVAVLRGSRLLGGTPHLADVGIAHAGPHALTVTGDVVVRRVDAGSSLTVRPEGDRMSLLPLEGSQVDLTRNDGTLDIAGVPASSPSSLPRGDIDVAILNTGTLRLDGVQLNHGLRNEGTTSVQRFVWLKSDQTLDNRGRLEIGPWLGQGIIGASLLSSGTVANSGTIVSTDPTAMISAERYEGSARSTPGWA